MLERCRLLEKTADEKQNLVSLAAVPIPWSTSLLELSKPLQKQVFWRGSRKPGQLPLRAEPPAKILMREGSSGPMLSPSQSSVSASRPEQRLKKAEWSSVIFGQPKGAQFPRWPVPPSPRPCLLPDGFAKDIQAQFCLLQIEPRPVLGWTKLWDLSMRSELAFYLSLSPFFF